jgi:hypothetical protein
MADFGRGIKAGVVTGIVYTVIYIVVGVIFVHESLYLTNLLDAAGLSPVVSSVYPSFFSSLGIFSNILRGIIFGVVFAALYSSLPGTTSIVKGVVLSSVLWIITVIEVTYTMPGWFSIGGTYYGGTVNLSSITLALIGIASALVFGVLTGFLWDRFRATRLVGAGKARPVLLVGFVVGGIIWVSFAMMFLVGRVPLIVTGSEFWWEQIVIRLAFFLGLPGWVLAFIAWRKTRRDKSGLRWAVVGGVMMALTGIMLLPGALAIIGGVLSGREAGGEPLPAAIGEEARKT